MDTGGTSLDTSRGRVRSHEIGPACHPLHRRRMLSVLLLLHTVHTRPIAGSHRRRTRSPPSTAHQETHRSSRSRPPPQTIDHRPQTDSPRRPARLPRLRPILCFTSCRRQMTPWAGTSRAVGGSSVKTFLARISLSLLGVSLSLPTPSDVASNRCKAGSPICGGHPNGWNTPYHLPKPNSHLLAYSPLIEQRVIPPCRR